jgi:hypothetical protein
MGTPVADSHINCLIHLSPSGPALLHQITGQLQQSLIHRKGDAD